MLRAAEPVVVTVSQLLATPTEFDGTHVSVIGYYVEGFDRAKLVSCLFPNACDSNRHRGSIWVDQATFFNPGTPTNPAPPLIGISEVCAVKEHYVRVVGVFRSRSVRGFGPGRHWSSEITGIVNFRVSRKTACDPKNPCGIPYKKATAKNESATKRKSADEVDKCKCKKLN
jgi:hypothetical protein